MICWESVYCGISINISDNDARNIMSLTVYMVVVVVCIVCLCFQCLSMNDEWYFGYRCLCIVIFLLSVTLLVYLFILWHSINVLLLSKQIIYFAEVAGSALILLTKMNSKDMCAQSLQSFGDFEIRCMYCEGYIYAVSKVLASLLLWSSKSNSEKTHHIY